MNNLHRDQNGTFLYCKSEAQDMLELLLNKKKVNLLLLNLEVEYNRLVLTRLHQPENMLLIQIRQEMD